MEVLQTLLVCYAVLLAISSIVCCKLWLFYRTKPFLLLMLVWPLTLANFVLQGFFVDSLAGSVFSFSTYFFSALCLAALLNVISETQFNWGGYGLVFAASCVTSATIYMLDGSFFWVALPVAIAIAAPQIFTALNKLIRHRSKGPELTNMFAVTLLLNGLHFLDYPYLRPVTELAVYGFGLVMIITILFSLLLPVILSKHNANQLNERLQQEMEQTQQLAKAKSDFLANMSHEIRTPINGIRGINDLLLSSGLTAEQRQYCEITRQSIDHLTNIISDVLSLSQLESGKINMHTEVVSSLDFQKEILDHYSIRPDVGALKVSCDMGGWKDKDIILDRAKVLQVLFNLVNNAIKYTTGSDIKISFDLEASSEDERNAWLKMAVYDNGEGIDQDAQKVIFSAFEQLATGKGGVGLGLSIVSRLVDVLGGSVALKSSMHFGTEFTCKIPVQYARQLEKAPAISANSSDPSSLAYAVPNGCAVRVLAVEDDPTSQIILAAVFQKEGIAGKVVDSAESALAELKVSKFEMIITDVNLPGITGLELVEAIRATDPNIPIIIQSAFAFDDDTAQAKKVGATAYLRKPLTYQDIVKVCEQFAGHTKSSSLGAA